MLRINHVRGGHKSIRSTEKCGNSIHLIALFLYFGFAALTSIWFLYSNPQIGGDQISYYTEARVFAANNLSWINHNALSSILGALLHMTEMSVETAFILIYFFVTIAYLSAMHFGIGRYIKNPTVRILVSIISTTPFYTLGMTHWGFAEFELIRGRIFSTIFAPIAIRWFFDYRHLPQGSLAYILVGLTSGFLSLEAVFLLPIFFLTELGLLVGEKAGSSGKSALMHFIYFGLGIGIVVWCNSTLTGINHIHSANVSGHELLDLVALDINRDTISLLWEINYFGFWWTMFPPRLSDLAYMIIGGFPLFFIVALSIVRPTWSTQSTFSRELWRFFFAALITAYSYQILIFLGWKLFNLPPSHFEEVRAVKYALFPCFIFVGFLAAWLLERRRYLSLGLVIISLTMNPYRLAKAFPNGVKQQAIDNLAPYFLERSKLDYVNKAVGLSDVTDADRKEIFEILRQQAREDSIILSDINELRSLGFTPWINYESKRPFGAGVFFPRFDKEQALNSVRWFMAYREAQAAIYGVDSEALIRLMERHNIEWAITSESQNHAAIEPMHAGKSLFLLRLKN